jgi:hypothetical protein
MTAADTAQAFFRRALPRNLQGGYNAALRIHLDSRQPWPNT